MADSTKKIRANTPRILNITFTHLGFPRFENLKNCHVEDDNIESLLYLQGYQNILHPAAPSRNGEGFVPKNPNSKKMWLITSILTTLSKILMCFREKFPKHPT
jgi:hypothetical protein